MLLFGSVQTPRSIGAGIGASSRVSEHHEVVRVGVSAHAGETRRAPAIKFGVACGDGLLGYALLHPTYKEFLDGWNDVTVESVTPSPDIFSTTAETYSRSSSPDRPHPAAKTPPSAPAE